MKKICKRVLGIGLAVMLCLGLAPTAANALPFEVDLVLPASEITVNSTFNMAVIVSGVELPDEVLAFGFDVAFDTNGLGYAGATVGPNFDDVSASLTDTDVAGLAFPGVTGDNILLASLSFTTLDEEGIFNLGIISDLSNDNQGLSTLSQFEPFDITNNTEVTVTAAAPVPEPGTLLLIITGLGGLGFLKRKRS